MDLVLGLSMTSADVRWVLVEGTTAEGATICRDAVDFDTLDDVLAAVGENRLHAIGVTWANEADTAASTLLDALADKGPRQRHHGFGRGSRRRAGDGHRRSRRLRRRRRVHRRSRRRPRYGGRRRRCDDRAGRSDGRRRARGCWIAAAASPRRSSCSVRPTTSMRSRRPSTVPRTPVITAAEADLALARGAALASAQARQHPVRLRRPGGTCRRESVR